MYLLKDHSEIISWKWGLLGGGGLADFTIVQRGALRYQYLKGGVCRFCQIVKTKIA